MSLGENITNAVYVLNKTYQGIEKLMDATDRISAEEGFTSVSPASPRFLRWKSDQNAWGWFISSFIKVYQHQEAPRCASGTGLRKDSIYGMEISLDSVALPKIILSRTDYPDLEQANKLSSSDHWRFHWPVQEGTKQIKFQISSEEFDGKSYKKSVPILPETKKNYWNIEKALFIEESLADIKSDNIKSKVFDGFRYLSRIQVENK